MIVHWRDLSKAYDDEIDKHEQFFGPKHQTTYALLCCNFTKDNVRVRSGGGVHAEQRLLESSLWVDKIPRALDEISTLDDTVILVTMAINRSPCRQCAGKLANALKELQWEYPERFEQSRFILASTGAYRGKEPSKTLGYYDQATTEGDLKQLAEAGWRLCVLQAGDKLTTSGDELNQALQRLFGLTSTRVT